MPIKAFSLLMLVGMFIAVWASWAFLPALVITVWGGILFLLGGAFLMNVLGVEVKYVDETLDK